MIKISLKNFLQNNPMSSMAIFSLFIAAVVTLSPYTITRLIAQAEDAAASTTPEQMVASVESAAPADTATTTDAATTAPADIQPLTDAAMIDFTAITLDLSTTTLSETLDPLTEKASTTPNLGVKPPSDASSAGAAGAGGDSSSGGVSSGTPLKDSVSHMGATTTAPSVGSQNSLAEQATSTAETATPSAETPIADIPVDIPTQPAERVVENAPSYVAPDPAIAPGLVSMKIEVAGGAGKNFPIRVIFVAVGGKKIVQTIDSTAGSVSVELTSGRYYTEIETDEPGYTLEGDSPRFFLNASEKKDFGTYTLTYRAR